MAAKWPCMGYSFHITSPGDWWRTVYWIISRVRCYIIAWQKDPRIDGLYPTCKQKVVMPEKHLANIWLTFRSYRIYAWHLDWNMNLKLYTDRSGIVFKCIEPLEHICMTYESAFQYRIQCNYHNDLGKWRVRSWYGPLRHKRPQMHFRNEKTSTDMNIYIVCHHWVINDTKFS